MSDGLAIPAERQTALEQVRTALLGAKHVVLTTHVNADGDGAGSEAALAAWLMRHGVHVTIVNPTPFPDLYRHLVEEPSCIADAGTDAATRALESADLLCVVDTGERGRIGRVVKATTGRSVVVIDHHPTGDDPIEGIDVRAPEACATGELIHDLIESAGLRRPWPQAVVDSIYTAILTDTGSFRFSNTTPRAHAIAADLIAQGVDPEETYRRIFATVPLRRVALLRHALEHLVVDAEAPITHITIDRGYMDRLGCGADDLEGVVDHARSIEGTEVALLLRATSDGATKVSFRSSGDVDVNAIARRFGGGGHAKASGAVIGAPVEEARTAVLEAVRAALAGHGPHPAFRPGGGAP